MYRVTGEHLNNIITNASTRMRGPNAFPRSNTNENARQNICREERETDCILSENEWETSFHQLIIY